MEAIVLFSHGSVLCGAERNLIDVAQRMKQRGDAPIVEPGFLNYCEPAFETAVDRAVAQGATRILVAPWFLIEGKFVVEDLPKRVAAAASLHPEVAFRTGGVLGFHEAMADAVLASAAGAQAPSAWRARTEDAGVWCRENPKCPLYGRQPCRVRTA